MKNKYNNCMTPHVENYQKSEKCYSQKYDQSPTRYIERNDRQQEAAASKLRGQAYKGRYE